MKEKAAKLLFFTQFDLPALKAPGLGIGMKTVKQAVSNLLTRLQDDISKRKNAAQLLL